MQDYWLNPVMEDQRGPPPRPSSLFLISSLVPSLCSSLSFTLSPSPLSSGEKEAAACRWSSCARRSPSSSRGCRARSDAAGPAVVEEGPSRASHAPPGRPQAGSRGARRAARGERWRRAGRALGAATPSGPRAGSDGAGLARAGMGPGTKQHRRPQPGKGGRRAYASAAVVGDGEQPRIGHGGIRWWRQRQRGRRLSDGCRGGVGTRTLLRPELRSWEELDGWREDGAPVAAMDAAAASEEQEVNFFCG